ncbi:MAG: DUF2958 domain-containing protein [Deltaproteobacteria bacterium]|nr:DUF2958 domain-containing protein [Deltaproteobacteria bacterium]
MKLLTNPIKAKLLANSAASAASPEGIDHKPVVKLFGGSAATWLISEMDEDGIMFGLADLGFGSPELGYVSYEELEAVRFPPFGLPIERDMHWEAEKLLSEYGNEARSAGYIVS